MRRRSENYPIDIVIPWVDGNDPNWIIERKKYAGEETSSVHEFNYMDWGLLKYWFRGIEKNADWVRNVYFVTWGHIPEWLNTEHPKLHIVRHEDYIPKEYLPTFSSHTIELNLHRIKGIADHFIYFNDDTYLVNSAEPEDFFKKGLPCDTAIVNPIAPISRGRVAQLKLTNIAIMNEYFRKHKVILRNPWKWFNLKYGPFIALNLMFSPWNRFPGLYERHLPISYLKKTYEEVWSCENDQLDQTCRHKFRDFSSDVNQWIMKEWQVMNGQFYPKAVWKDKAIYVSNLEHARKAAKAIENGKYIVVCVNDNYEGDGETLREIISVIEESFKKILPEKSLYER